MDLGLQMSIYVYGYFLNYLEHQVKMKISSRKFSIWSHTFSERSVISKVKIRMHDAMYKLFTCKYVLGNEEETFEKLRDKD